MTLTRKVSVLLTTAMLAACGGTTGTNNDGGRPDTAASEAATDTGASEPAEEAGADVSMDTAPEAAAPEAGPEPTAQEAGPEPGPDVVADTAPEAAPDVVADAADVAPPDSPVDAAPTCPMAGQSPCTSMGTTVCANLQSDPQNCGTCGTICPMGQSCTMGTCACPSGRTTCGSGATATCVDTASDNTNCGMCGRTCPAGQTCRMGTCACPGTQTACGMGAAATCVDTASDNANCGMCGNACPMGQSCTMGTCTCPSGQTACGMGAAARCVNVQSDNANCGMCGNACPMGQSCQMGTCVCPMGQTRCGMGATSTCVDTAADPANCGTCGAACPMGQLCNAGMCQVDCSAPRMRCGTGAAQVCTDVQNDENNCGMCGNRCAATANAQTATCLGGTCSLICRTNYGNCDGNYANGCETDISSNANNCGRCGNVCSAGATCQNGNCIARSCREILAAFPASGSGIYQIDPDGLGPQPSMDVYCDMTTAGGGWTLLATAYNTPGGDTRRWNTNAVFTDGSTFGTLANRDTDDYKSAAYTMVTGSDVMFLTEEYHVGFTGLAAGGSFAGLVSSLMSNRCSETWQRSGADFGSSNLTATQLRMFGFTIRGRDINGNGPMPNPGCAVDGTNEASYITLLSGPGWWVHGIGNCVGCAIQDHDHTMLRAQYLGPNTCTANSWPCNANGLWWGDSQLRGTYPSTAAFKTARAQIFLR